MPPSRNKGEKVRRKGGKMGKGNREGREKKKREGKGKRGKGKQAYTTLRLLRHPCSRPM